MYGKIQVYLNYHPPGYYGRILKLGHIEKNIYKASSKCHIARKDITLVKVASYSVQSKFKIVPIITFMDIEGPNLKGGGQTLQFLNYSQNPICKNHITYMQAFDI